MKFYIDTCIWIDLFENRIDKFRPLGDWAIELVNQIVDSGAIVVFSELLLYELGKLEYSIKDILEFIPSNLLFEYIVTQRDRDKAKKLSKETGIPYPDAMHTIIAINTVAFMITRDMHYETVSHLVEVKKPEDLI